MKSYKFTLKENQLLLFKKRSWVRVLSQRAIRNGTLIKPDCCSQCKRTDLSIHAHHTDYGRPFDVIWLCSKCHGLAHRYDSPLNPDNCYQSPLPGAIDQYKTVHVTFTIPTENYLGLKMLAKSSGKSVSQILREDAVKKYKIETNQMEFDFMKEEDDFAQDVRDEGIQSLGQDKAKVQEEKPRRQKRDLNLQRVEQQLQRLSG